MMLDASNSGGKEGLMAEIDRFGSLSVESKKSFFCRASDFCAAHSSSIKDGLEGDGGLWEKLRCCAVESMDDDSPDVRRTAGVFLGDISKSFKSDVYANSKKRIFEKLDALLKESEVNRFLSEDKTGNVTKTTSSLKHLDSWICCLANMATGTEVDFCKEVDVKLLGVILYCLDCRDMYLEQDCIKLVHALLRDCKFYVHLKSSSQADMGQNETMELLVKILLKGMTNLNPGTRYESCKAIREILLLEGNLEQANFKLVDVLIPALWFNRYSKETGLQQLCQETWVELTAGRGRPLIEAHFSACLDYCFRGLHGESARDRVNSCHCLSEAVRKLARHLVDPKVEEIYEKVKPRMDGVETDRQTLDAACLLVVELVSGFAVSMESHLSELLETAKRLQNHPSPNVMDGSALLLSRLVVRYGPEKTDLKGVLNDVGRCFDDFASNDDVSAAKLIEVAQTSELPGGLCAFAVERKDSRDGTSHEIKPVTIRCGQEVVIHPVYGRFCLVVHLLPILNKDGLSAAEAEKVLGDIGRVLQASRNRKLDELSTLMLSRLLELFEAVPKMKKKRLLEELLETIVSSAKQAECIQLKDESRSLLEKLERIFGTNLLGAKLASIDEEFARWFRERGH